MKKKYKYDATVDCYGKFVYSHTSENLHDVLMNLNRNLRESRIEDLKNELVSFAGVFRNFPKCKKAIVTLKGEFGDIEITICRELLKED